MKYFSERARRWVLHELDRQLQQHALAAIAAPTDLKSAASS
jgi:hypothetical protein